MFHFLHYAIFLYLFLFYTYTLPNYVHIYLLYWRSQNLSAFGAKSGIKTRVAYIPSEGIKASVFHGIFEFPSVDHMFIFSWVKGGLLTYTHKDSEYRFISLSMSMCWWDLVVYFLSVRFIFYVSFNGSCQQENRPPTTHLLVDLSFGKKLRF